MPAEYAVPLWGRYSMCPNTGGVLAKPCSLRNTPTSTSGFVPASILRNSLRMYCSPKMMEVLLCCRRPKDACARERQFTGTPFENGILTESLQQSVAKLRVIESFNEF